MAYLFYSNHPVFKYSLELKGTHRVLVIEDLFDPLYPTMTVTNGVDFVLEKIYCEITKIPSLVIYRDSEGGWDRILVEKNKFLGFAPIVPGLNKRIVDRQEAIELAILNYLVVR